MSIHKTYPKHPNLVIFVIFSNDQILGSSPFCCQNSPTVFDRYDENNGAQTTKVFPYMLSTAVSEPWINIDLNAAMYVRCLIDNRMSHRHCTYLKLDNGYRGLCILEVECRQLRFQSLFGTLSRVPEVNLWSMWSTPSVSELRHSTGEQSLHEDNYGALSWRVYTKYFPSSQLNATVDFRFWHTCIHCSLYDVITMPPKRNSDMPESCLLRFQSSYVSFGCGPKLATLKLIILTF